MLAHRTLHCFLGEGHITNRMSPKLNWHGGKIPFPSSFERLPLGSQEGGIPCCWHTLATLAQTPYGVEKWKFSFYVLSPSPPQHRLDSPKPRDLLEPEPCPPPKTDDQYVRQSGLPSVTTEMGSFRRAAVPFLDCGSAEWYLCHFHFLKVRVGLWKVVKQHAKCEMSTLTLNFPCSEHHMKISLGFIVAFWFW